MSLFDVSSLASAVYHDGLPVQPGDVVVPVLAVVDNNADKATFVRGNPVSVADVTPPVFTGLVVSATGDTSVTLGWDAVSDDVAGSVEVAISSYSSASGPTAEQVFSGTGSGFVARSDTVADGAATTAYEFGAAGAEGVLTPSTTYHFYAVAKDAANNYSSVLYASSTTTAPVSAAPLGNIYPPADLTGPTTVVSGAAYGDGTYNVTWTGTYSSREPWRAFNTDYRWDSQSGGSLDNSTWFGSIATQPDATIELPSAIFLDSFRIRNGNSGDTFDTDYFVVEFVMEGSNDGVAFTPLVDTTGSPVSVGPVLLGPYSGWESIVDVQADTAYKYFRFTKVRTADGGTGISYIGELELLAKSAAATDAVAVPGAYATPKDWLIGVFDNLDTVAPSATVSGMSFDGTDVLVPVSTLDGSYGNPGFIGAAAFIKGPFLADEFTGVEVTYNISSTASQNNKGDGLVIGYVDNLYPYALSDNYAQISIGYESGNVVFTVRQNGVTALSTTVASSSIFSTSRRLSITVDQVAKTVTLEIRDPGTNAVQYTATSDFSIALAALSTKGVLAQLGMRQHTSGASISTRRIGNIVFNP